MDGIPPLLDVDLLKEIAVKSEKILASDVQSMPNWGAAYTHLAIGAGLLWRLVDQARKNRRPNSPS